LSSFGNLTFIIEGVVAVRARIGIGRRDLTRHFFLGCVGRWARQI